MAEIFLLQIKEETLGLTSQQHPLNFYINSHWMILMRIWKFFKKKTDYDINVNISVMGEKIYLISLLSWTTSQVLLTDQTTL